MKTYLKIKIKSLAAEAKIIRVEEKKHPGRSDVRTGLYLHRINEVRTEARAALVAYGFLRGRLYAAIEPNPVTAPNWRRVERLIEKYSSVRNADAKTNLAGWRSGSASGS